MSKKWENMTTNEKLDWLYEHLNGIIEFSNRLAERESVLKKKMEDLESVHKKE